jgi:hypothetical protein
VEVHDALVVSVDHEPGLALVGPEWVSQETDVARGVLNLAVAPGSRLARSAPTTALPSKTPRYPSYRSGRSVSWSGPGPGPVLCRAVEYPQELVQRAARDATGRAVEAEVVKEPARYTLAPSGAATASACPVLSAYAVAQRSYPVEPASSPPPTRPESSEVLGRLAA